MATNPKKITDYNGSINNTREDHIRNQHNKYIVGKEKNFIFNVFKTDKEKYVYSSINEAYI